MWVAAYFAIALIVAGIFAAQIDPKDKDAGVLFWVGVMWPAALLFALGFSMGSLIKEKE